MNKTQDTKQSDGEGSEFHSSYSRPQRIAAMIGIVLIFGLAIATLVVAITDSTGRLFRSFLMLTIAAPILIWVYIWLYGKYTRRHTLASFDFMGNPDDGSSPEENESVSADDESANKSIDSDSHSKSPEKK